MLHTDASPANADQVLTPAYFRRMGGGHLPFGNRHNNVFSFDRIQQGATQALGIRNWHDRYRLDISIRSPFASCDCRNINNAASQVSVEQHDGT